MEKLKNFLSIAIIVILLFTSVGCQQTDPPIDEPKDLSQNTKPIVTELIEDKTQDTIDDKVLEQQKDKVPILGNPPSACNLSFSFYSYNDFLTYLETGAQTNDAYEFDPLVAFNESYPTPEELKIGYVSIEELFGVSDATTTAVEIAGFFPVDGGMEFYYYVQDSKVTITYSPSYYNDTVSSNPLDRITISNNATILNSLSEAKRYSDCYIARNIGETNLVYCVDKGSVESFEAIIGNYRIHIYSTCNTANIYGDELAAMYHNFIQSETTAPFAVLFSEDDAVVEQAIKRIASVIEAKEASLKASAN